jgi:hypothetical protein
MVATAMEVWKWWQKKKGVVRNKLKARSKRERGSGGNGRK